MNTCKNQKHGGLYFWYLSSIFSLLSDCQSSCVPPTCFSLKSFFVLVKLHSKAQLTNRNLEWILWLKRLKLCVFTAIGHVHISICLCVCPPRCFLRLGSIVLAYSLDRKARCDTGRTRKQEPCSELKNRKQEELVIRWLPRCTLKFLPLRVIVCSALNNIEFRVSDQSHSGLYIVDQVQSFYVWASILWRKWQSTHLEHFVYWFSYDYLSALVFDDGMVHNFLCFWCWLHPWICLCQDSSWAGDKLA